jgi:hypothetical protein
MLEIFKIAVPVLLRVKPCAELGVAAGWLGKTKVVGERLPTGAVPVPVRLTVWGLFVALSVKVNVAARLPAVVGVNVTLTVQVPFTPTGLTHVLV